MIPTLRGRRDTWEVHTKSSPRAWDIAGAIKALWKERSKVRGKLEARHCVWTDRRLSVRLELPGSQKDQVIDVRLFVVRQARGAREWVTSWPQPERRPAGDKSWGEVSSHCRTY